MRVILDTDPGNGIPAADIDDGLALGLALRSPEIELEAVTIVAGNVSLEDGIASGLALLDAAGADGIPVHAGAARPLVEDPRGWRALLDGRAEEPDVVALWDGVALPPSERALSSVPAAEALIRAVSASPGEVTVVAVGPLTNVATAMLLAPAFAEQVARIVVMGGAFEQPGVIQELNFSYDPEAAHIVLSSVAPLTIVPLDVTLQTFLRLEETDRLARAGTPLATYLAETVRPWVRWLAERFDRDGCPLHDPLAMATLIDPSLVRTRTVRADIELRGGLTRGRSVAWDPDPARAAAPGLDLPALRPVEVADEVDNDRFVALMLERLSAS